MLRKVIYRVGCVTAACEDENFHVCVCVSMQFQLWCSTPWCRAAPEAKLHFHPPASHLHYITPSCCSRWVMNAIHSVLKGSVHPNYNDLSSLVASSHDCIFALYALLIWNMTLWLVPLIKIVDVNELSFVTTLKNYIFKNSALGDITICVIVLNNQVQGFQFSTHYKLNDSLNYSSATVLSKAAHST